MAEAPGAPACPGLCAFRARLAQNSICAWTTGDGNPPRPPPLPLSPFPAAELRSRAARAEETGEQLLPVPSALPFDAFQNNPAEFRTAAIQQKRISKGRREILHVLRRREVNRNL